MPKDNPPRWITVRKVPFDYKWPGRTAITSYTEPGEYMVKGEVADYAVANDFATEGKADGSDARSRKGKSRKSRSKATSPAKSATPAADAGPDTGQDTGVGGTGVAADDRARAGQPVAPAAD